MTEGQLRCSYCILKWRKLSGFHLRERDCVTQGRRAEVRTDLWLVHSDRNCKYMCFEKIHLSLPVLGSLASAKVCYRHYLTRSALGVERRCVAGQVFLQGSICRCYSGGRLFGWPLSEPACF